MSSGLSASMRCAATKQLLERLYHTCMHASLWCGVGSGDCRLVGSHWVRSQAGVYQSPTLRANHHSTSHVRLTTPRSEGGFFNARLTFPKDYPNSPPQCRFTSEMWHPNGMLAARRQFVRHSKLASCPSCPVPMVASMQAKQAPHLHVTASVALRTRSISTRACVFCVWQLRVVSLPLT